MVAKRLAGEEGIYSEQFRLFLLRKQRLVQIMEGAILLLDVAAKALEYWLGEHFDAEGTSNSCEYLPSSRLGNVCDPILTFIKKESSIFTN